MFKSEHFKDSNTLEVKFSIISNVDWKLCSFTIGAGGLYWAPISERNPLVFECNTLGGKHETDSLSTSLHREVDYLGHIYDINL